MKDIAGALHPSARSGDPRTAATRDHHRWAAAAEDPAGGDDDNTHYCTCGNKHKGDCHFDGVPCTEEQFNAIRKAFRQPQQQAPPQPQRGGGRGRGLPYRGQRGNGRGAPRGVHEVRLPTEDSERWYMPVRVISPAGIDTPAHGWLVDCGADCTMVQQEVAEEAAVDPKTMRQVNTPVGTAVGGANFDALRITTLQLDAAGHALQHNVLVSDQLAVKGIIGRDLLRKIGGSIDIGRGVYTLANGIAVSMLNSNTLRTSPDARAIEAAVIPAKGCVTVPVRVDKEADAKQYLMCEAHPILQAAYKSNLSITACVLPRREDGYLLQVRNLAEKELRIPQGMPVARCMPLTEAELKGCGSIDAMCEIGFQWNDKALNNKADRTRMTFQIADVTIRLKRVMPVEALETEPKPEDLAALCAGLDRHNRTGKRARHVLIAPGVNKAVLVRNPHTVIRELRNSLPIARQSTFCMGEARGWSSALKGKAPVVASVMADAAATPAQSDGALVSRILGDDAVRAALTPILREFKDRAPDSFMPGQAKLPDFEIELKPGADMTPIAKPVRRIPQALLAEVCDALEKGLANGSYAKSTSSWASPLVIVRKKDGGLRLCQDYRALNDRTVPLAGMMPSVHEAWDTLKTKKYFSLIDLRAGYNQIRMSKDAAEKAAFMAPAPFGLLEPLVLNFGLRNAPARFQREMWKIFAKYDFVYVYMDDILIASDSAEQHAEHVRRVLAELREKNLFVAPNKCSFGLEEIKHLGHIVGRGQVRTDPEKVKAVVDAPAPQTIEQLQSFLGMVNFYRIFLGADVATVMEPLTRLLKGATKATSRKTPLNWSDEQTKAFEVLKQRVATNTVLDMPDWNKPFGLATDASNVGIGAVLFQTDEQGIERPVAFFSRVLNAAERNYSTTDRELLGIVEATDHFRHYIYGRQCKVYTDHSALQYLSTVTRDQVGRNGRWLSRLGEYDLSFTYRPGKLNANADACSRLPIIASVLASVPAAGPYLIATSQVHGMQPPEGGRNLRPRKGKQDYAAAHAGTVPRDERERRRAERTARRKEQAEKQQAKEKARKQLEEALAEAEADEPALDPNDPAPAHTDPEGPAQLDTAPEPVQGKRHVPHDASEAQPLKRTRRDEPLATSLRKKRPTILREAVEKAQASDVDMTDLKSKLSAAAPGDKVSQNYVLRNGLLFRYIEVNGRRRAVLPVPGSAKELKQLIMRECHDSTLAGHNGVAKTCDRIRESFWWRGLESDVRVYTRSCDRCQAGKTPRSAPAGKMVVGQPPSHPWEEVGIDFVGPMPVSGGYKYVCCVTDLFTGFVIAWPARDCRARTFAEDFIRNVVVPGHTPYAVRHDRGSSFQNALVKHLLYVFHVLDMSSSGYHPQFNGAVERTNGTFAQLMRTSADNMRENWHLLVPLLCMTINSSVCAVRKDTPFFLNHGRDFRTPLAIAAGASVAAPKRDLAAYRPELIRTLQEHHDLVQARLIAARAKVKERFDETRSDKHYAVGDLVWLYTPLAKQKGELHPKYRPAWVGPMRVTRTGEVNYALTNLTTGVPVQSRPHVSRLKPYHPRHQRPQGRPDALPDNDNFDWDVETYLARVNQLAPGEEAWHALVPDPPEGSTVPTELLEAEAAAGVADHPTLRKVFHAIHAAYVTFLGTKKVRSGGTHTWGSKATRNARHSVLRALALNGGTWYTTTERRTHWAMAAKDAMSGDQLERFMRSVLVDFPRLFAEEIYLHQYLVRQRAQGVVDEDLVIGPPKTRPEDNPVYLDIDNEVDDLAPEGEGPELGEEF